MPNINVEFDPKLFSDDEIDAWDQSISRLVAKRMSTKNIELTLDDISWIPRPWPVGARRVSRFHLTISTYDHDGREAAFTAAGGSEGLKELLLQLPILEDRCDPKELMVLPDWLDAKVGINRQFGDHK